MTGHLGVCDLGRMCRVCSTWREAAVDDEAWAHLCLLRWANTACIPRSVLSARGHRWLYAQRQKGVHLPAAPVLPPPTLSADELTLLVDIRLEGVPRASFALTGAAMEPLLSKGSINLPLAEPIELGEAHLSNHAVFELDQMPDDLTWDVSVHLLRATDAKCVCLFSYEHASWEHGCERGDLPKNLKAKHIDWSSVEPPPAYLELVTDQGGLELSDKGAAIAKRIDRFDGLYFELFSEVKQPRGPRYFGFEQTVATFKHRYGIAHQDADNDFDAFSLMLWHNSGRGFSPDREQGDEEDGEDEEELWKHFREALAQPAEERQMRITEFTLFARYWGVSDEEPEDTSACEDEEPEACEDKKGGVTLLHLLEGLRAWDED